MLVEKESRRRVRKYYLIWILLWNIIFNQSHDSFIAYTFRDVIGVSHLRNEKNNKELSVICALALRGVFFL